MAESKLKIDVRRAAIMEKLRQDGSVRSAELVELFGATPVTIRTDLAALEQEGNLIRTRGGAICVPRGEDGGAYDPDAGVPNAQEKRRLAEAVVGLVYDGDTILINAGTTTQYVAEALMMHKNLNIVTNSLPVAMKMGQEPTFHVILLGGKINTQYGFTYGADVHEQLARYHADIAIMSIDGVSADTGISTHLTEESVIDRLILEHSTRHIVVADHTKVGRVGFTNIERNICGFTLVTGAESDPQALEALAACGVEAIVC